MKIHTNGMLINQKDLRWYRFDDFGCYVALYGNGIFAANIMADGSVDLTDYVDVSAPEPGLLVQVNAAMGTAFKMTDFAGMNEDWNL